MKTPVFTVQGLQHREAWGHTVFFMIGVMAMVSSFLIMAGAVALWAHPIGLLLFPLLCAFLWREGFFDWVGDLRAAWARRDPRLPEAIAARSVDVLREAALSANWDSFVGVAKPDLDHVRILWAWGAHGLTAEEIHLTSSVGLLHHGTPLSYLLDHTPTIGWDAPVLRRARGIRGNLSQHRFGAAILSVAGPIPRGSAHARLALRAWAQSGA